MLALAGAALWLAICVSFAVPAAIIGMPPQTIVYTIVVWSLNFGAVVGAIIIATMVRAQHKLDADRQYH